MREKVQVEEGMIEGKPGAFGGLSYHLYDGMTCEMNHSGHCRQS